LLKQDGTYTKRVCESCKGEGFVPTQEGALLIAYLTPFFGNEVTLDKITDNIMKYNAHARVNPNEFGAAVPFQHVANGVADQPRIYREPDPKPEEVEEKLPY
jgi:hypothetical protein